MKILPTPTLAVTSRKNAAVGYAQMVFYQRMSCLTMQRVSGSGVKTQPMSVPVALLTLLRSRHQHHLQSVLPFRAPMATSQRNPCQRVYSVRGNKCKDPTDTGTCCQPVAKCISFTCPDGHLLRAPMPEHSTCAGMKCEDPTDTDTCCEQRGKCSDLSCPKNLSQSRLCAQGSLVQLLLVLRLVVNPLQHASVSLVQRAI